MTLFTKLSTWYFTKRALPYWGILLMDCLAVIIMGLLIYTFKFGIWDTLTNIHSLSVLWTVYLIPYLIGFKLFHTYSGIIRYSSFVDLQRVGFAMMVGTVGILIIHAFVPWDLQVELYTKSGLLLVGMLSTMCVWMLRVMVKFFFDITFREKYAEKLFIYGAREGGVSIAKSIRNSHKSKYQLAGFITDEINRNGMWLMGVPIYKYSETIVSKMIDENVSVLMVSPLYTEEFRKKTRFVDQLIAANIRVLVLEGAEQWDGKTELLHSAFHKVDVEDLLPRDQIQIDMDEVGKLLTGKKILITGAAGSIGSEMVRQIADFHPEELVLIDQAETPMHDVRLMMAKKWSFVKVHTIVASISNATRMDSIFKTFRPDYVFHAAAYKHVPMMEDNPSESVQNNIYGTRVLADLAVKYETKKFVMISTDKAVNPTNVMGCSKRICEIYVQSLDRAIKSGEVKGVTQFVTTRFGNVLGSNGSVIPLFREQIKNGGPLTVTHPDIIRFFMLIPEACKLVLEAGTMGNGGEIFVFDMGQPVKIADLAKRMIQLSGAKNIEIKYTGLRDGEKLYEEVLSDAETTKPTHHPKIKIAAVREYDFEVAREQEDRLYKASFNYDDMETVRIMKEIVPEFRSQHSKYEALDSKLN